MKELLLDLHRYNCWANTRLAQVFSENQDKISDRSRVLFSHLLNAQFIWLARIRHEEAPYKVFQLHDVPTLLQLVNKCSDTLLAVLQDLPDEQTLQTNYTYTNTQGKTYTNSLLQIVTHVVNHSTYHRAQVATDMRQTGLEPINTDYITYARELNGEA